MARQRLQERTSLASEPTGLINGCTAPATVNFLAAKVRPHCGIVACNEVGDLENPVLLCATQNSLTRHRRTQKRLAMIERLFWLAYHHFVPVGFGRASM